MNTSQKRIKCFRVNKENQAWSRCPLHKAAAALFVRYARQAAAVLARADICRATDSERLCRELAAIRPASGCRATDSERLCRELAAIRPASGCRACTSRHLVKLR